MVKCSNCGANIDGMKFCSECGTRVPQDKECPACKARMPIAAKFCSECGYNFSNTDRSIVERAPIPLHLDIARDEAERIADALGRVGATVELFDHDAGTQTHGNCSVVLQSIPSGMSISSKAGLGAEIAMLLGCMPRNAFKMLDDLPLTVAENVSREEADEIVNKFAKRKCVAEIV